jgi:hypothetical protein
MPYTKQNSFNFSLSYTKWNEFIVQQNAAFSVFMYHKRRSVFDIKNQEIPAHLELKSPLSSGTLLCLKQNVSYVTSHNTVII